MSIFFYLANGAIAACVVASAYRRDAPLSLSCAAWLAGNAVASLPLPTEALLAAHLLPATSGAALAWYRLANDGPMAGIICATWVSASLRIALAPMTSHEWYLMGAYGPAIGSLLSLAAVAMWILRRHRRLGRPERAAMVIALGDGSGLLGVLALGYLAPSWVSVEIQALITAVLLLVTQLMR